MPVCSRTQKFTRLFFVGLSVTYMYTSPLLLKILLEEWFLIFNPFFVMSVLRKTKHLSKKYL